MIRVLANTSRNRNTNEKYIVRKRFENTSKHEIQIKSERGTCKYIKEYKYEYNVRKVLANASMNINT